MEIKQYITMTVGLIVGVLLIAGVVAPVIADVSSNGGSGGSATTTLRNDTGDTNYYFKPVTQSTHMEFVSGSSPDTIYAYVGGSATQEWSSHLVLAGDTWTVTTSNDGHFWMSSKDGRGYAVYQVEVNGSEVTLTVDDGWAYPENVRYYSWYEGDYVVSMSSSTGRQVVPYLASDSQSYIGMGFDDGTRVTVVGSKDSNSAHYVYEENYDLVFEDLGTADVSIENNKLKSVTCTYNSVSLTFDWNSSQNRIAYAIVPVEVTVSGSSGPVTYTNSGDAHYSIAGSSSSMTYYPVGNGQWSLDPSSVADREVYDTYLNFIGESIGVGAHSMLIGNSETMEETPRFMIDAGEDSYSAMSLSLNGTTLSFLDIDSNQTVSIPNIVYYADPNGDYVDTLDYESYSLTSAYATSESRIVYMVELDTYQDYAITIFGTVGNNKVSIERFSNNGPTIDSISDSAVFTIVDGELTTFALTINGSEYVYDANLYHDDGYIDGCILPVTVSEGGSGGSGIPSTLATVLTVVPLVMTVGLVLGAIGYMRMKD